jgi:hypothetical protein
MDAAQESLVKATNAWTTLERAGFTPTVECPDKSYVHEEIMRDAATQRDALVDLIPYQETALRAYVREAFPSPPATDVPYECFERDGVVSAKATATFRHKALSFYELLRNLPSAEVSVEVRSDPAEGRYTFTPIYLPAPSVENVTNSSVTFSRAKMTISITRRGYKATTLLWDFVITSPRLVYCHLEPIEAVNDSWCKIDSQTRFQDQ